MKYKRIKITICQPCLDGEGRECHSPACALFLHRVDLPIIHGLYEELEEFTINEDLETNIDRYQSRD